MSFWNGEFMSFQNMKSRTKYAKAKEQPSRQTKKQMQSRPTTVEPNQPQNPPSLTYLSDDYPLVWTELQSVLQRMFREREQTDSAFMPILTRYSEADWDVRRRSDAFDVAKMHKARRRAEKGLGNCISRIVPITPMHLTIGMQISI